MKRAIVSVVLLMGISCYCGITSTNPWLNTVPMTPAYYPEEVRKAVNMFPEEAALFQNASAQPVAFWLDSMAKIANLTALMESAKATQQSIGRQVLVEIIIYDLPNRDCAAYASNGEILCDGDNCTAGLSLYQRSYIDPIVTILAKYPDITVVALIEPDSLPNLVTNINVEKCQKAKDAYIQGTAYAVAQLAKLSNVAIYIDAAHGGWMGWPSNLAMMASTFNQVLQLAGGANLIRGFATNTANYQPLGSMSNTVDYCNLRSQYNQAIDEVHYVSLLNDALTSAGISGKGFIIDTSRNGVPNARKDCSNWCNIVGAGLGERPTANAQSLTGLAIIDALHWGKVPGESDGISDSTAPRYDIHCSSPDSVSEAPQAGQFWPNYYRSLCQNASPSL
jgi:cellulose 1,4-beta-cellobiosidase